MVLSEDSRLLPNREVYVSDFVEEESATSNVTYLSHNSELISTFAKYLESESYLDVTLICANNQIIKAHKLVLASVSPLLKEIFDWEGTQNEVYISLPDINRRTMKLVLDFFYVGHMNFELEEMSEFKSALGVLGVSSIQDAIITKASANPSVGPPKLMILDSKQKRELGKKNRQSKIVESVSLSSLYVPNTVSSTEEEEPIIDMNVAVESGVSSKASSIDPENDPLNVPDFYYVQQSAPAPLPALDKQASKETSVSKPPSMPSENIIRENNTPSTPNTLNTPNIPLAPLPPVRGKLAKKKAGRPAGGGGARHKGKMKKKKKKRDKSMKHDRPLVKPSPEKPVLKPRASASADQISVRASSEDLDKSTRYRVLSQSLRPQSADMSSVSTPPPAAASVPVNPPADIEPPAPADDQDGDPIDWLEKLTKEELVEQLQQFDLDTSGSILALRTRLSYYLQHELQTVRDSPPHPLTAAAAPPAPAPALAPVLPTPPPGTSSSISNQTLHANSSDKLERRISILSSPECSSRLSLKRKQPVLDIAIGLKQPRLVIRDVKDEVNLTERMRVSSLPNLFQRSSNSTNDLSVSGTNSTANSIPRMLSMSPSRNVKLPKKPKDLNLRPMNVTDSHRKQTPKAQTRRKTPLVPTSTPV